MSAAANHRLGSYVTRKTGDEGYKAFVPAGLPPVPALHMPRLNRVLDQAIGALGTLNSLSHRVPDTDLFLYMYVRKEALLSSQIEGTQSSLSDLLKFGNHETPLVAVDDVEEISNYIAALNYGLGRMKEGFPISNRLIREMHGILLRGGRGANADPGEFRRSQNWIGGTRPANAQFVPAPPEMVEGLMSDLEKFIHDDRHEVSTLIKAALVHVQFETIHPFLDGNGRMGRLLITLMLCADELLTRPLLYLSLHLKKHRALYYDFLTRVRTDGDWEAWCHFFLDGVMTTANSAMADTYKIIDLLERDRTRIKNFGRGAGTALQLHDYLLRMPYLSITKAAISLGISVPTITSAVLKLVEIGLLKETTGQARNRMFEYTEYLAILLPGTEPLRR